MVLVVESNAVQYRIHPLATCCCQNFNIINWWIYAGLNIIMLPVVFILLHLHYDSLQSVVSGSSKDQTSQAATSTAGTDPAIDETRGLLAKQAN